MLKVKKTAKKIILPIISFACAISLCSCKLSLKVTGTENYQKMYTIVKEWNKHATLSARRNDLFGFGEYLYNSYLILFPRETPTTLTDFYFEWHAGIDVDTYETYFTCQLDENNFNLFKEGLDGFSFSYEEFSEKPIYDTEHFDYPAYILQWMNPHQKWQVYEYILLDDVTSTIIFVYTMGWLEPINKYSQYNIMPNCDQIDVVDDSKKNYRDETIQINGLKLYDVIGFSIYGWENSSNQKYDNSFLSYLF
ncbi:MAG: hypothetical protein J1F31_04520 [Erysipelotrichales bacterium]|nr:hypothetical protein [Erysipelotrichales bacterium]